MVDRLVEMTPRPTVAVEAARGLLLLGVFHVHALYSLLDHLRDPASASMAGLQIKFLTAYVVLFFALSGLTSQSLPDKPLPIVAQRSLMLLLLAVGSHVIGVLIEYALWKPWHSTYLFVKDIGKPIVLGTGYSTFGWFFVVLAVVRLFAFAWARNARYFLVAAALGVAAVAAARALGLPDNLYEWRYWPAALVMFVLGMRLPQDWRVPPWAGALAALVGLLLPLFNSPTFLRDGFCLDCHPEFLAEPMVGRYGFLPLFFLQAIAALIGLLWLSRLFANLPVVGRLLAYIGRRSMQMLVLHGWISLSVYGLAGLMPPRSVSPWLFVALFVVNTFVHLVLYRLLQKPLDRFVAGCAAVSHRLLALLRAVPRMIRRHTAMGPPR